MLHIPTLHGTSRRNQVTVVSAAAVALLAVALLFATVAAEVATAVTFGAVILAVCVIVMVYAARHREPLD